MKDNLIEPIFVLLTLVLLYLESLYVWNLSSSRKRGSGTFGNLLIRKILSFFKNTKKSVFFNIFALTLISFSTIVLLNKDISIKIVLLSFATLDLIINRENINSTFLGNTILILGFIGFVGEVPHFLMLLQLFFFLFYSNKANRNAGVITSISHFLFFMAVYSEHFWPIAENFQNLIALIIVFPIFYLVPTLTTVLIPNNNKEKIELVSWCFLIVMFFGELF